MLIQGVLFCEANLSKDAVALLEHLKTGIYYGYVQTDFEPKNTQQMVMSLGWNPYFQNKEKSAEVHILETYGRDFYGATLHLTIMGYLRDERDFSSIEELKNAIRTDIEESKMLLGGCADQHQAHI